MKLYQVKYRVWNSSFSNLSTREQLSVGNDETEAIERIKQDVDQDARDFTAQELSSVFGYKINVQELVATQDIDDELTEEMESGESMGQLPVM